MPISARPRPVSQVNASPLDQRQRPTPSLPCNYKRCCPLTPSRTVSQATASLQALASMHAHHACVHRRRRWPLDAATHPRRADPVSAHRPCQQLLPAAPVWYGPTRALARPSPAFAAVGTCTLSLPLTVLCSVQLGHDLVEPFPALTPLTGPHPGPEAIAGVSLDVAASVRIGKRTVPAHRAGFLFTHKGAAHPRRHGDSATSPAPHTLLQAGTSIYHHEYMHARRTTAAVMQGFGAASGASQVASPALSQTRSAPVSGSGHCNAQLTRHSASQTVPTDSPGSVVPRKGAPSEGVMHAMQHHATLHCARVPRARQVAPGRMPCMHALQRARLWSCRDKPAARCGG